MDNDNKKKLNEELAFVTGGSGGFPDGEMPEGKKFTCPRCGARYALDLVSSHVVEDSGNPTIDSTLTDKTRYLYHCNDCSFDFWRYGNFWEKA